MFRDIAFNACEGSEIYLALPEDLEVKSSRETTDSAISRATDFKLPNVLPLPSWPESNHSTTPLSLDFKHKRTPISSFNSKETDSIFEVFNSVLREIQTENNDRLSQESKVLKLSPATFSRGSRFQAAPIGSDISYDSLLLKNDSKKENTLLVEVYHKNDDKLAGNDNNGNAYYKRSKKLYFSPKFEKKITAVQPRRKKRTVIDSLDVSRPYAVIYAKVPDTTRSSGSKPRRKNTSERLVSINLSVCLCL